MTFAATLVAQQVPSRPDISPHLTWFITVDKNVNLEILDWGGSGRSLILLAGLGDTAHVFDQFAPGLTATNHVYGITRRGFGRSSAPTPTDGNYTADRLSDDVLAVIASRKLNRPVLVGHSIAGEELSSVGSRHPETIAGLIYLDAAYGYAYYGEGDGNIEAQALRRKIEELTPGRSAKDPRQVVAEILDSLPHFEKTLREWQMDLDALPPLPTSVLPALTPAQAILEGEQKYVKIAAPALAIYSGPQNFGSNYEKYSAWLRKRKADREAAFEKGVPSARVVRLKHSTHFVFISNEAEVLRK
jgi:pimeloyl-ACP methyl ester carboxylesterase